MPAKYVPGKGWIFEQAEDEFSSGQVAGPITRPPTVDEWVQQRNAEQQQELMRQNNEALGGDNRPFVGGGTVTDLLKAVPNAVVGVGTDLLDLAAGVTDIAVETGRSILDESYEFNVNNIFDDSDNPWTQARRNSIGKMDTKAGEIVNQVGRLAGNVIGFKWIFKAPAIAGRVQKLGKLASSIKGLDAVVKPYRSAKAADALADVARTAAKVGPGARAARIASKNAYLNKGLQDISKLPEAASWWKATTTRVGALAKTKINPRNVAETIAWDVWGSFNVMGEGDTLLDETVFDMAADIGVNVPLSLQTTVDDSALWRKTKGMLDGTLFSVVGGGIIDMWRINRYAKAFKSANAKEKKAILEAFQLEADELGRGVASLADKRGTARFNVLGDPNSEVQNWLARKAGIASDPNDFGFAKPLDGGQMAPPVNQVVDPWEEPGALARLDYDVNTERIRQQYELEMEAARQASLDPNSPVQNRLAQMEGVASPRSEDASYQDWLLRNAPAEDFMPPQPPGADKARVVDGALVNQRPGPVGVGGGLAETSPIEPVRVKVLDTRPAEPTVTPQTIRAAVRDGLVSGMDPNAVRTAVRRLMPRKRVDLVEYMTEFPGQVNQYGVVDAADSIWMNYITNRGLTEGWATLDPATWQLSFSRKRAYELDAGEIAQRDAAALDQALESSQYQEWLQSREPMNPGQLDSAVQDNLAQKDAMKAYDVWEADQAKQTVDRKDAMNAYDAWEAGQARQQIVDRKDAMNAYDQWEADPARQIAQREAVTAEIEGQQLEASELSRMADDVTGVDPKKVTREMLGIDLDQAPIAEVAKVEGGRGWEVISPEGEVVTRTTTKRQGQKIADRISKEYRDELVKRAKQQAEDGQPQQIDVGVPAPLRDGDAIGSITVTSRQLAELERFSATVRDAQSAFWAQKYKGKTADEVGNVVGRKTFDMAQGEMASLADGFRALLQTGDIPSPRAKVLKNLIEKLESETKRLEPQVRMQRTVDSIVDQANRYLDHGDFC